MKYVFALGNPGKKYALNYHNIGKLCAEYLLQHIVALEIKEKEKYTLIKFEKFVLIISNVYMNVSFQALREIHAMYKIKPQDLLVLHDELMLKKYEIRLKQGGGNAGHNGLRDLSQYIGSDFCRLRIGIGHPREFNPNMDVSSYVLSNIDDLTFWQPTFEKAMQIIFSWLDAVV